MKRTRSAFQQAKPLTPAAAARERQAIVMEKMARLMEKQNEGDFLEGLTEFLELKPGEERFEAALKLWRDSQPKP